MTTNLYSDARPEDGPLATPAIAMTIGAHPDDAEFGAAGTLGRWAQQGCAITMVILTDGSKGTWNETMPNDDLIAARRAEQRRAADVIGAGEVIHLDHVDGELELTPGLRQDLARLIRAYRPQVVLGHDPWRRYMLHPDHRAAGFALVDAVVAARDHLFYPEQGLAKHRPDALLLWQADEPDHHEDIASTFELKVRALLSHSSQTSTTMGGAAESPEARARFVERMSSLAAAQGEAAGLAMAEAFKLIRP
jgi:LmbE family N-acetylglucosaminyl deacetylase